MLSFTVRSERILPYFKKYGFEPETYFDIVKDESGLTEYSISEAYLDFNNERYIPRKLSVKEFISNSIDQLKSDFGTSKDENFEELLLLIFCLAANREVEPNNDITILHQNDRLINIIQSIILIKEHGLDNIEIEIRATTSSYGKSKEWKDFNKPATFLSLDFLYSSYNEYFHNIANFLYVPTNYFKKNNLDIRLVTSEQLIKLKDDLKEILPPRRIVETKGTLMLRDYLSDHFEMPNKGLISYDQVRLIYTVYTKMGWVPKPDFKSLYIDRFVQDLKSNYEKITL